MKNLFYTALFFLSTFCYGQIIFENGYFIDKNGDRKDVLIKNYDWKNNPSIIEYKTEENTKSSSQIKTSELQEFVVGGQKYVMATVMIDRSSARIEDLSINRDFDNREETVLLKLLVEGKKSLYRYYDGSIKRFFYKKQNDDIYYPLNYKEYLVNNNFVKKNEEYKNQLNTEFLDNEKITSKQIKNLMYNENSLEKIFIVYNNIDSKKIKEYNNFHFYIKPGIGFSQYNIGRSQNQVYAYLDNNAPQSSQKTNKALYRISTELEYVLNFNKGKWALISEPTFQTTKFSINNYLNTNFDIKYTSLQIPLGVKYNMFLNKKSKLYASASLYYQLLLNNDIFATNGFSLNIGANSVYQSFAIGYNYDKLGAELKWGGVPSFKTYYDGPYNGIYYFSHGINMDGFNLSISYKLF